MHRITLQRDPEGDPNAPSTAQNSQVLLDGKVLQGVTSINISLNVKNPLPKVTIEMVADVQGQVFLETWENTKRVQ